MNKLHFKERTIFMISRVISLSVVVIIFIGVTIISINIIIPQVVHSFYTILEKVPSNIKELENFLKDNIKNVSLIEWINTKVGQVDGNIVNILNNISKSILSGIIDISLGITASIINSILGIIIAIYILLDKEKLKRQLKLFIYRISNDKYNKLRRYIGGQAIDATILFIIIFVTMAIFKMPYMLLISLIIGISAIMPIFGPFIGALISILIMFIGGYDNIGWFIVLVIVMQQIEGNIIYPIVVGNSIGLS